MTELLLTGRDLSPEDLDAVARAGRPVRPAPEALAAMARSRAVVESHLAAGRAVYGLTTGLGSRVTHSLPREVHGDFSRLTVRGRSHAVGPPMARGLVRAVMTVRLNGLLSAGAGADPALAEMLAALLNQGLHPVLPGIGSIGAGDLCVLAQLGRAVIGEGEIEVAGTRLPAEEALAKAGLNPLSLGPKDGLAICNASSYGTGLAALALVEAEALAESAQIAAALSMEGFRANPSPLDARAVGARPAPGQGAAAERLRALLAGGALLEPGAARRVQDPISLRCASQVHGALLTALDVTRAAIMPELNGAADNPLVLTDDDDILSTGNFHTPALALALEMLSQAVAQTGALAVSRTGALLLPRLSDLPLNLSPHGADRSGFAPLMKVAMALQQEIRHGAQPAPHDLRWSADGVEDDLTNGPLAAKKLREQLEKLRLVLSIELIVAAQAVDMAEIVTLGHGTAAVHRVVRGLVELLDDDRPLSGDIERLAEDGLASGRLNETVEAALQAG
ncbi:MAG: aromatic amino acid lyase [Pseudomonadota bacterium]